MLKRVRVERLIPGVQVHEICGSWMDHPFWKTSFKIRSEVDLKKLLESGVSEVWIDTSKGLDVDSGADDALTPAKPVAPAVPVTVSAARELKRTSLAEEAERAQQICDRAKAAVTTMFTEVRMGQALRSQQAIDLVDEIAGSIFRNPGALISLSRLKTKDDYTFMHSVAVCGLMVALGRQLGLPDRELRDAGLAGLLHDIGKMAIPETILNKPGALTDAEFASIKTHPRAGHNMLAEGDDVPGAAMEVCLHHHERVDGKGYPDRLAGVDISLLSRMGAVCDVYDAITSDRPYKKAWGPAEAIKKMAEWAPGQFDDRVFHAFVRTIGIYPTGSLVRLASNRLAVVLDQGTKSLLEPTVRVFYSVNSDAHVPPEVVDLARGRDKIVQREDPASWGFGDLTPLWRAPA